MKSNNKIYICYYNKFIKYHFTIVLYLIKKSYIMIIFPSTGFYIR